MKMRSVLPLAVVLALGAFAGCEQPVNLPGDEPAKKSSDEPRGKPAADAVRSLAIAPPPRTPGEPLLNPPAPWVLTEKKRPWKELIVGKWLKVKSPDAMTVGQNVYEYTRDGKRIQTYSWSGMAGIPDGSRTTTTEYILDGDVLSPTSTWDDGIHVHESTIFVESLGENELVTRYIVREWLTPEFAAIEARQLKIPLAQAVAQSVRERRGEVTYVRLRDKK